MTITHFIHFVSDWCSCLLGLLRSHSQRVRVWFVFTTLNIKFVSYSLIYYVYHLIAIIYELFHHRTINGAHKSKSKKKRIFLEYPENISPFGYKLIYHKFIRFYNKIRCPIQNITRNYKFYKSIHKTNGYIPRNNCINIRNWMKNN